MKGQFKLHKVQQTSDDDVVLQSKFTQKTGTFFVPALTTAVFVEHQPGPPVSRAVTRFVPLVSVGRDCGPPHQTPPKVPLPPRTFDPSSSEIQAV